MSSALMIATLLASTWLGAAAVQQAKSTSMTFHTLQEQEQVFTNIWSGEDLIFATRNLKVALIQRSARLHGVPSEAQCDSVTLERAAGPLVQMLGMKSVGTNLFLALASHNLNVSLLDHLNFGCSLLWKHSPPGQIMSGRPDIAESAHNVNVIAIVRNPLSQFAHYFTTEDKKAEEKNMCGTYFKLFNDMSTLDGGRIPLEAFDQHCGPEKEHAASWDGGATYQWEAASLAQLWNDYVSGYIEDLDTMGFRRTMVMRFEDLVTKPEAVMKTLADFVGVPAPNKTWVPISPQGPSMVTHKAAMIEITNSTYLEKYTPRVLQNLCLKLDLALMRRLNYTECEPVFAQMLEYNIDQIAH